MDKNYATYRSLLGLGEVLIKFYSYEEATEVIARAIKTEPDNPLAYIQLGDVYSASYSFEMALEKYQEALALGGNTGEI